MSYVAAYCPQLGTYYSRLGVGVAAVYGVPVAHAFVTDGCGLTRTPFPSPALALIPSPNPNPNPACTIPSRFINHQPIITQ